MNLVDMFVLFLWKKFSVNDIIHSEKLNKMYQDNSEIKICSANAAITLPVSCGLKVLKTIVCAASANYWPVHLL